MFLSCIYMLSCNASYPYTMLASTHLYAQEFVWCKRDILSVDRDFKIQIGFSDNSKSQRTVLQRKVRAMNREKNGNRDEQRKTLVIFRGNVKLFLSLALATMLHWSLLWKYVFSFLLAFVVCVCVCVSVLLIFVGHCVSGECVYWLKGSFYRWLGALITYYKLQTVFVTYR